MQCSFSSIFCWGVFLGHSLCYVSEHSTLLRLSQLWSALKSHPDVFSKLCSVPNKMNSHLRDHICTPNNVCTECTHIFNHCVQAKVALSSLDADSGNWSAPTISYCPGRLFFHLDLLYFVCWLICMEMDQFRKCVQLGTSLEQIFLPNNFSL